MSEYLILRLKSLMQSWGSHSYEDFRPSALFPTRSALIGLLSACIGIERKDLERQQELSESFRYAARLDKSQFPARKITDFHTVLDARKVDGSANKNPVVSRREYLCDASFTVALLFDKDAMKVKEEVVIGIQKPVYTPFLGRRSCPLSSPLYHSTVQAASFLDAMSKVEPFKGTIYSEDAEESPNRFVVRDIPLCNGKRQFGTRKIYIHAPGGSNVSK